MECQIGDSEPQTFPKLPQFYGHHMNYLLNQLNLHSTKKIKTFLESIITNLKPPNIILHGSSKQKEEAL